MQIEYLKVKNFRAFKELEMRDIPPFCVIVGANGTGKTTLFEIFGFLKNAMTDNVQTALIRLGGSLGFSEVRSRGCHGSIEIELRFRKEKKSPKITYVLEINEENGKVIIKREILKYCRASRGKPWHFLDFRDGTGDAVTNESTNITEESLLKREQQTLKSPDILAIKGLSQFQKFPAVKAMGDLIENWYVSDFHISEARREPEAGYAEYLSRKGENLAQVTEYFYKQHPDVFKIILSKLSARIPGLSEVTPIITEEGRVSLRFRDDSFERPFIQRHVSDGTIKMLAYLILLYDPEPWSLLCIEEPENQLYPSLLMELAEEFRNYAHRGGQVFVSTHSPDFLNAVQLSEVFWLIKKNGYTTITRAKDNKTISNYMAQGDQMGSLWKQGFFDDVDPKSIE